MRDCSEPMVTDWPNGQPKLFGDLVRVYRDKLKCLAEQERELRMRRLYLVDQVRRTNAWKHFAGTDSFDDWLLDMLKEGLL